MANSKHGWQTTTVEAAAAHPVPKKRRLLPSDGVPTKKDAIYGVPNQDSKTRTTHCPGEPASATTTEWWCLPKSTTSHSLHGPSPKDCSHAAANTIQSMDASQSSSSSSSSSSCQDDCPGILSLPDELLAAIGTYLNVGSLKQARLVCHKWNTVLSTNTAGWTAHCQRLWHRKQGLVPPSLVNASMGIDDDNDDAAFGIPKGSGTVSNNPTTIPKTKSAIHNSSSMTPDRPSLSTPPSTHNGNTTSALRAYQASCRDARLRHLVHWEELVYDPIHGHSTIWEFRCKHAAGPAWTAMDPWHAGKAPRKMVFLPNGSVQQIMTTKETTHDNNDEPKGGPLIRLGPPFADPSSTNNSNEFWEDLPVTWRFIKHPLDLPAKTVGAYVRLTVGGRELPVYLVHRSPTGNWGFLMENCWGVFASFALPPKQNKTTTTITTPCGEPLSSNDSLETLDSYPGPMQERGTLTRYQDSDCIPSRNVGQSTTTTILHPENNNGLHRMEQQRGTSQPKAASEQDDERCRTWRKRDLLEDESLSVTRQWQWREALLFNMGATTLPQGPNATQLFEQTWQEAMRRMGAYGLDPTEHGGGTGNHHRDRRGYSYHQDDVPPP